METINHKPVVKGGDSESTRTTTEHNNSSNSAKARDSSQAKYRVSPQEDIAVAADDGHRTHPAGRALLR